MAPRKKITPEFLYQIGVDAFDSFADYEQWLGSEIPNLGGRTPSSLVHTVAGRTECYAVLNAIMHGIYL